MHAHLCFRQLMIFPEIQSSEYLISSSRIVILDISEHLVYRLVLIGHFPVRILQPGGNIHPEHFPVPPALRPGVLEPASPQLLIVIIRLVPLEPPLGLHRLAP